MALNASSAPSFGFIYNNHKARRGLHGRARGLLEGLEGRLCMTAAFAESVDVPTEIANATYQVSADFNGDGKADLALADGVGKRVQVYLAKADGNGGFDAFGAAVAVGDQPRRLVVADFTNDGKADILVGTDSLTKVYLLLGAGGGTFEAAQTVPFDFGQFVTASPLSPVVGDFNSDGRADVAFLDDTNDADVYLLLSHSDPNNPGPFAFKVVEYAESLGSQGLAAADFDGDGKLDLVVGNQDDKSIGFLKGHGDATFDAVVKSPLVIGADRGPRQIAVGDVNGDGKPDVVAVNSLTSHDQTDYLVAAVVNNGNGTFGAAKASATEAFRVENIALADFDKDGKLDVATVYSLDGRIRVMPGNGDGSFGAQQKLDFSASFGVTAADVNGDGKVDLLSVAKNRISYLLNTTGNTGGNPGGGDPGGGNPGGSDPGTGGDKADLVPSILSTLPSNLLGESKGKVQFQVINSGTAASGATSVKLVASLDGTADGSDAVLGTFAVPALKANKSKKFTANFTYPAVQANADYAILAVVDEANGVSESNETNNTAAKGLVRVEVPAIDLTASIKKTLGGQLQRSKGGKVSVTLQNLGSSAANTPATIALLASTDGALGNDVVLLSTETAVNLKPNKSKTLNFTVALPETLSAGTNYTLGVQVDPANALVETSKANNTAFSSATFTVA